MSSYNRGYRNGNPGGANGPERQLDGSTLNSLADRLPPQNLEAERGVLGSVLLDNTVMSEIVPILRVEDFYRDSHQILYRLMRELYDKGKPIDALIVLEELGKSGQLDRFGGEQALDEIVSSVPHAANAKHYAGIVREKSVQRQLIAIAGEILQEGYSNNYSADELLQKAERRIFRIAEEQAVGDTVEMAQVVVQAMDRIADRANFRRPMSGLSTGLTDLDDVTTGFQGSQLIILAARPSMGKSALALNICEHVALEQRKAVLVVSLEMGKLELAERFLCSRARVDGHKVRTGFRLGGTELTKLGNALSDFEGAPIFLDDTPTRTMLEITANARRIKMKNHGTESPLGLVVIDYIQLIEPEAGEGRDSRQEQIARISRRLKMLARELDVPVIALSQLNRQSETREDRRPRMADLRESGAIEQDADLVLLLHRPDYYDPNDNPGVAELNIAKNRNGRTETVKLAFLKNIMRFENLAPVADVPGGVDDLY